MDAPRIKYARTEDGVNIAYWRIGAGTPLIYMAPPFLSHVGLEWEIPDARRFYERLAESCQVIRFDFRGSGLSDRDVQRIDIDAYVDDLSAVVSRADLGPSVLTASIDVFKVAVKFTSQNPKSILGLVGLEPEVAENKSARSGLNVGLRTVRDADWSAWSEMLATSSAPPGHSITSYISNLIRESTSPSLVAAFLPIYEVDVTELLDRIDQPSLTVHEDWTRAGKQHNPWDTEFRERTRRVATWLPDSRFVVCQTEHSWWAESVADAIASFMEEISPHLSSRAGAASPSAFRTILFTDLEAHTAMMQRLGDAKGREVLREHERISREALRAHGGTEVKTIGDSFMASFPSAQKALECAIALQRAFAGGDFAGERLRIRVGINAGEPIADEDDLFGSSVILAARAASKATAGQVLVTNVVRELVAGKGFVFADAGEFEMKGFEEPVRLFELRWQA